MASPFAFFRKNQRVWMAALVIVAIVSFVILPNLDSLVQPDMQGRRNSQTLVSWKGGEISAEKLEKLQMVHAQTYNIFSRMASEVIQAGGTPKVPGFAMDPQGQGMEIGIEPPQNIQSVLQVRLMAEAAKKRGVVVDDHTVDQFIQNFSDKRISAKRFDEIIREVAGQSLSKFDMYDFLRDEIAKQILVQMGYSGLAFSQQSLVAPSKNWMNYRKFNQRAKVEAFPFFVDQFLDKVTVKPSEQELRVLFDKAKDRLPIPNSPEPGFRQPYRANIEFLMADLNTFLKDEEAKVSEELLRSTYEKRVKEDGAYQVPDEGPKPSASTETPTTETPTTDKPAAETPVTDKPATEKPVEASPTTPPEASAEPASSPPAEPVKEPASPSDSSQRRQHSSLRLVALQTEPAAEKSESAVATKAEDTPPPTEPAKAADTPAEPSKGVDSPSESNKPADTSAAVTPSVDSKELTEAAKAPDKPMRVRTFEEVREDLRRELAMQPAQQRLQAAVNAAQEVMDNYFNQLQLYKSGDPKNPDTIQPALPSLVELANQLGLSFGKTGMVDAISVEQLPIGRSFTNFDSGQARGFNFEMFSRSVFNNNLRLFQPATSQGFAGGTSQSFVFWKIEQVDSRVPPFDEVREQVLTAWKLAEARKLATKAAEELAGSINTATEADPWTRLLDPSLQPLVLRPPMFTWLQPMLTGNEGIQLSMIEGIDQPGPLFMEKSFSTPIGKAAVAMDAAQQKCFVIRVLERSPSDEQLLAEFEKAPLNRGVVSLALQQASASASRWFDSLVEELEVDLSKLSSTEEE